MAQHLKRSLGGYRFLVLVFVLGLVVAGGFLAIRSLFYTQEAQSGGQTIPVDVGVSGQPGGFSETEDSLAPPSIQLSEGQAQPQPTQPVALVTSEPLSAEEIERILARLPALPGELPDQVDFNPAGGLLPPPRTGETIQEAFPPPAQPVQPEPVADGPLEVLRYAPQGEIPVAPFVSITFNQPMIPLATLGDLALDDVPARLEPPLPGTWSWLGTRTLTFEYDSDLIDRLRPGGRATDARRRQDKQPVSNVRSGQRRPRLRAMVQ